MNDIALGTPTGTVENPGTVNLSTTLQPGTIPEGGGGQPSMSPEKPDAPEKSETLQDVLADEMRKGNPEEKIEKPPADAKDTKPEPEPKAAAKPEKAEPAAQEPVKDGADPNSPRQDGKVAPSEGDDPAHPAQKPPPERLTEDAKRYWRSTPVAIKGEIHRMEAELQRVTQESGEALQLHSEVKQYVDMAKQAGTTVKAALDRYVQFDRQIAQDFGKGIAAIAKDQGRQPQEVITGILRAYGVTPQQFAQAVIKNPQAFMPQQQAPRDPMIQQIAQQQQAIMQRFQQQEQENRMSAVVSTVDQWASDKPDFRSKESAIAEILKSGIIERIHGQGLTDVQRLDAAYRMAGGNAGSIVPQSQNAAPTPGNTPPLVAGDPGKKSVRGAPADGLTPASEEPYSDIRDLLRKEMRRMA